MIVKQETFLQKHWIKVVLAIVWVVVIVVVVIFAVSKDCSMPTEPNPWGKWEYGNGMDAKKRTYNDTKGTLFKSGSVCKKDPDIMKRTYGLWSPWGPCVDGNTERTRTVSYTLNDVLEPNPDRTGELPLSERSECYQFDKQMCYKYVTLNNAGRQGDSVYFYPCDSSPTGFNEATIQPNPAYGSGGEISGTTMAKWDNDLYCAMSANSRLNFYPASLVGGSCNKDKWVYGPSDEVYLSNTNLHDNMKKMCYRYLGPNYLRTIIYPADENNVCTNPTGINNLIKIVPSGGFVGPDSSGTGFAGGEFWIPK